MGASCCKCSHKSVKSNSVTSLADIHEQATDLNEMTVEETRVVGFEEVETSDVAGLSELKPLSPTMRPEDKNEEILDGIPLGSVGETSVTRDSELKSSSPTMRPEDKNEEILDCIHLGSVGETSNMQNSSQNLGQDASDILWITGSFSDKIPNGFYSLIPDNRFENFKIIPTLDEINALGDERLKDKVILIDFEKDQKIKCLQDLIKVLVKGLNSTKAMKKIAKQVVDVYNRPVGSPSKTRQSFESRGFPLLGRLRRGSCRARAILFKVLADSVGYESKLVMGFPTDLSTSASIDSYNHISVVVVLDSIEMLVDLTRCPGQLIPFSPRAIFMAHISAVAQNGYAYNGYCDSILELNSPMHGFMDGINHASCRSEGAEKPETKRRYRNRMKTPVISDDIARATQVMKESSFLNERSDGDLSPHSLAEKNVSSFHLDSQDIVSGGRSTREPWKAISLPSSSLDYQCRSSKRNGPSHEMISYMWNQVLESPMFKDKPLLPYEDWYIDISELTVGPPIWSGSFRVVHCGIWKRTSVAVKKLHKKQLTAENMKDFCNEISILSLIRHPNVILFLGACTKPPHLSMVTEIMERGSLFDVLHTSKKRLNWPRKLKILRDICRGLACIHWMGIVHCDLKSVSCLINDNMVVKICDFGLSRKMEDMTLSDGEAAGFPQWMAPELMRNEHFSEKCDIFSFGVIMWELCTQSKPWKGVPKEKVIHFVANEGARLEIPESPLSELIADCWSEPEQRPSCEEIMQRLTVIAQSLRR